MISSGVIFVFSLLQVTLVFIASSAEIPVNIPDPENYLQVFAIPVGQGDCTIIQCPNGNIVVFDCGSRGGDGWSADLIENWLGNRISKVIAIIVSHADTDHNNYLPDIDWNFSLTQSVIVAGGKNSYTIKMRRWLKRWNDFNKLFTIRGPTDDSCIGNCVVNTDTNFCGNQNIQFTILAANVGGWQNPNEESIVMKIVVGQWSMLLSGDMEGAASIKIAEKLGSQGDLGLKSIVYKMSHHGASSKANQLEWLVQIEPQSVFTSSAFGYYWHPRCDTIGRLLLLESITEVNPHNFYCGYGGGRIYQYGVLGSGIKRNIWETSPDGTVICLLMYTSVSNQPVVGCQAPPEESQLTIINKFKDKDNGIREYVKQCDLS